MMRARGARVRLSASRPESEISIDLQHGLVRQFVKDKDFVRSLYPFYFCSPLPRGCWLLIWLKPAPGGSCFKNF